MNTTPSLIAEIRAGARRLVREWNLLEGAFLSTGYSYSQCHALFELAQHGSLSPVQLADQLLLDKSTTSRLLSNLLQKGLVNVQKDTADRRQKWYSLTEAGRSVLDRNNCLADRQTTDALELLAPEEQEQVRVGLALYAKALSRSRLQSTHVIRPIRPEDNPVVARIIREVMAEFGTVGEGYSSEDEEIDRMYEAYDGPRSIFYVIEKDDRLLGCGGVGPLPGGDKDICELRKMYFLPELRGVGLGRKLVMQCLDDARRLGYRSYYLETVDRMWQANLLYQKMGFQRLERRCGDTGHCSCEGFYELIL